jgi:electron transport complex protein RnfC
VDVCPTRLNPVELRGLLIQDRLDDAEKSGLEDCILCGACSFVCPAKRRLTATFKLGKDTLAVRRKKA